MSTLLLNAGVGGVGGICIVGREMGLVARSLGELIIALNLWIGSKAGRVAG